LREAICIYTWCSRVGGYPTPHALASESINVLVFFWQKPASRQFDDSMCPVN